MIGMVSVVSVIREVQVRVLITFTWSCTKSFGS